MDWQLPDLCAPSDCYQYVSQLIENPIGPETQDFLQHALYSCLDNIRPRSRLRASPVQQSLDSAFQRSSDVQEEGREILASRGEVASWVACLRLLLRQQLDAASSLQDLVDILHLELLAFPSTGTELLQGLWRSLGFSHQRSTAACPTNSLHDVVPASTSCKDTWQPTSHASSTSCLEQWELPFAATDILLFACVYNSCPLAQTQALLELGSFASDCSLPQLVSVLSDLQQHFPDCFNWLKERCLHTLTDTQSVGDVQSSSAGTLPSGNANYVGWQRLLTALLWAAGQQASCAVQELLQGLLAGEAEAPGKLWPVLRALVSDLCGSFRLQALLEQQHTAAVSSNACGTQSVQTVLQLPETLDPNNHFANQQNWQAFHGLPATDDVLQTYPAVNAAASGMYISRCQAAACLAATHHESEHDHSMPNPGAVPSQQAEYARNGDDVESVHVAALERTIAAHLHPDLLTTILLTRPSVLDGICSFLKLALQHAPLSFSQMLLDVLQPLLPWCQQLLAVLLKAAQETAPAAGRQRRASNLLRHPSIALKLMNSIGGTPSTTPHAMAKRTHRASTGLQASGYGAPSSPDTPAGSIVSLAEPAYSLGTVFGSAWEAGLDTPGFGEEFGSPMQQSARDEDSALALLALRSVMSCHQSLPLRLAETTAHLMDSLLAHSPHDAAHVMQQLDQVQIRSDPPHAPQLPPAAGTAPQSCYSQRVTQLEEHECELAGADQDGRGPGQVSHQHGTDFKMTGLTPSSPRSEDTGTSCSVPDLWQERLLRHLAEMLGVDSSLVSDRQSEGSESCGSSPSPWLGITLAACVGYDAEGRCEKVQPVVALVQALMASVAATQPQSALPDATAAVAPYHAESLCFLASLLCRTMHGLNQPESFNSQNPLPLEPETTSLPVNPCSDPSSAHLSIPSSARPSPVTAGVNQLQANTAAKPPCHRPSSMPLLLGPSLHAEPSSSGRHHVYQSAGTYGGQAAALTATAAELETCTGYVVPIALTAQIPLAGGEGIPPPVLLAEAQQPPLSAEDIQAAQITKRLDAALLQLRMQLLCSFLDLLLLKPRVALDMLLYHTPPELLCCLPKRLQAQDTVHSEVALGPPTGWGSSLLHAPVPSKGLSAMSDRQAVPPAAGELTTMPAASALPSTMQTTGHPATFSSVDLHHGLQPMSAVPPMVSPMSAMEPAVPSTSVMPRASVSTLYPTSSASPTDTHTLNLKDPRIRHALSSAAQASSGRKALTTASTIVSSATQIQCSSALAPPPSLPGKQQPHLPETDVFEQPPPPGRQPCHESCKYSLPPSSGCSCCRTIVQLACAQVKQAGSNMSARLLPANTFTGHVMRCVADSSQHTPAGRSFQDVAAAPPDATAVTQVLQPLVMALLQMHARLSGQLDQLKQDMSQLQEAALAVEQSVDKEEEEEPSDGFYVKHTASKPSEPSGPPPLRPFLQLPTWQLSLPGACRLLHDLLRLHTQGLSGSDAIAPAPAPLLSYCLSCITANLKPSLELLSQGLSSCQHPEADDTFIQADPSPSAQGSTVPSQLLAELAGLAVEVVKPTLQPALVAAVTQAVAAADTEAAATAALLPSSDAISAQISVTAATSDLDVVAIARSALQLLAASLTHLHAVSTSSNGTQQDMMLGAISLFVTTRAQLPQVQSSGGLDDPPFEATLQPHQPVSARRAALVSQAQPQSHGTCSDRKSADAPIINMLLDNLMPPKDRATMLADALQKTRPDFGRLRYQQMQKQAAAQPAMATLACLLVRLAEMVGMEPFALSAVPGMQQQLPTDAARNDCLIVRTRRSRNSDAIVSDTCNLATGTHIRNPATAASKSHGTAATATPRQHGTAAGLQPAQEDRQAAALKIRSATATQQPLATTTCHQAAAATVAQLPDTPEAFHGCKEAQGLVAAISSLAERLLDIFCICRTHKPKVQDKDALANLLSIIAWQLLTEPCVRPLVLRTCPRALQLLARVMCALAGTANEEVRHGHALMRQVLVDQGDAVLCPFLMRARTGTLSAATITSDLLAPGLPNGTRLVVTLRLVSGLTDLLRGHVKAQSLEAGWDASSSSSRGVQQSACTEEYEAIAAEVLPPAIAACLNGCVLLQRELAAQSLSAKQAAHVRNRLVSGVVYALQACTNAVKLLQLILAPSMPPPQSTGPPSSITAHRQSLPHAHSQAMPPPPTVPPSSTGTPHSTTTMQPPSPRPSADQQRAAVVDLNAKETMQATMVVALGMICEKEAAAVISMLATAEPATTGRTATRGSHSSRDTQRLLPTLQAAVRSYKKHRQALTQALTRPSPAASPLPTHSQSVPKVDQVNRFLARSIQLTHTMRPKVVDQLIAEHEQAQAEGAAPGLHIPLEPDLGFLGMGFSSSSDGSSSDTSDDDMGRRRRHRVVLGTALPSGVAAANIHAASPKQMPDVQRTADVLLLHVPPNSHSAAQQSVPLQHNKKASKPRQLSQAGGAAVASEAEDAGHAGPRLSPRLMAARNNKRPPAAPETGTCQAHSDVAPQKNAVTLGNMQLAWPIMNAAMHATPAQTPSAQAAGRKRVSLNSLSHAQPAASTAVPLQLHTASPEPPAAGGSSDNIVCTQHTQVLPHPAAKPSSEPAHAARVGSAVGKRITPAAAAVAAGFHAARQKPVQAASGPPSRLELLLSRFGEPPKLNRSLKASQPPSNSKLTGPMPSADKPQAPHARAGPGLPAGLSKGPSRQPRPASPAAISPQSGAHSRGTAPTQQTQSHEERVSPADQPQSVRRSSRLQQCQAQRAGQPAVSGPSCSLPPQHLAHRTSVTHAGIGALDGPGTLSPHRHDGRKTALYACDRHAHAGSEPDRGAHDRPTSVIDTITSARHQHEARLPGPAGSHDKHKGKPDRHDSHGGSQHVAPPDRRDHGTQGDETQVDGNETQDVSRACKQQAGKKRKAQKERKRRPESGAKVARSRNPWVAAALAEVEGRSSESDDGDWSDMEDFIVWEPERDYDALFRKRYRYRGASDEEDAD